MSNYIRLTLGQPLEVVLQDPSGLDTTSPKDRPQAEFKLADGRTLCATPFQAGKIRKLNPQAGDRLRLLMRKNTEGKSITEAELIPQTADASGIPSPAPPTARPPAPVPISGERVETMTKLGELLVHGIPLTDADDPGYRSHRASGNGYGSQNGNGNGHKPPQAECELPATTGHAQFYLERATELIDVVAAAFHYAITAHNGMFSKDDIRAMVATMYIQHTPKGGR